MNAEKLKEIREKCNGETLVPKDIQTAGAVQLWLLAHYEEATKKDIPALCDALETAIGFVQDNCVDTYCGHVKNYDKSGLTRSGGIYWRNCVMEDCAIGDFLRKWEGKEVGGDA